MLYLTGIFSLLEVLIVTLPILFTVAFVTIAERKTMASMQRRVGPNKVGYYGLLQAFADALKLLLKEYVSPTQANLIIFFLGPLFALIFSLLGYGVIPFGPGLTISDFDLGILFMLAVSSLATYGILLAGWSANSKYAFLGSLRSTAQLISYELILSSVILIIVLLTSSLNLTANIESQKAVWFIFPLAPLFYIFFIGSVAETNRAPFDLAEAESELVSGFMTEHSAVIFVFFFLGEYASIVLMCILISILFLGGYHLDFSSLSYLIELISLNVADILGIVMEKLSLTVKSLYSDINHTPLISFDSDLNETTVNYFKNLNITFSLNSFYQNSLYSSLILSFKTVLMIFTFIWVRASFPRVRFDQLMSQCWTIYLPATFALVLLIPCIMYILNIFVLNYSLYI